LGGFLAQIERTNVTYQSNYYSLADAIGFCQKLPYIKPKDNAYEDGDQIFLEYMAKSGDRWVRAIAKRKMKTSTWQL
jgi:hypothetical protein